jgi:hypothetical protein
LSGSVHCGNKDDSSIHEITYILGFLTYFLKWGHASQNLFIFTDSSNRCPGGENSLATLPVNSATLQIPVTGPLAMMMLSLPGRKTACKNNEITFTSCRTI